MPSIARVDANQKEITDALRDIGATVQPIHTVGKGCPDLLVGYHGLNILLELKDGEKSPSRIKLTPAEKEWHDNWFGQVAIVKSKDEALDVAWDLLYLADFLE